MDKLTQERRSGNMSKIGSKNTKPEMQVRRIITKLGYRYRLHAKTLPGKPDLVFGPRKCVIFVHGCFWHQHKACREGRVPRTRREYWVPKLKKNAERDQTHIAQLVASGWRVLVIWECEVLSEDLPSRLQAFLAPPGARPSS